MNVKWKSRCSYKSIIRSWDIHHQCELSLLYSNHYFMMRCLSHFWCTSTSPHPASSSSTLLSDFNGLQLIFLHYSSIYLLFFNHLVQCFIYKMSENSEKYLSPFTRVLKIHLKNIIYYYNRSYRAGLVQTDIKNIIYMVVGSVVG